MTKYFKQGDKLITLTGATEVADPWVVGSHYKGSDGLTWKLEKKRKYGLVFEPLPPHRTRIVTDLTGRIISPIAIEVPEPAYEAYTFGEPFVLLKNGPQLAVVRGLNKNLQPYDHTHYKKLDAIITVDRIRYGYPPYEVIFSGDKTYVRYDRYNFKEVLSVE